MDSDHAAPSPRRADLIAPWTRTSPRQPRRAATHRADLVAPRTWTSSSRHRAELTSSLRGLGPQRAATPLSRPHCSMDLGLTTPTSLRRHRIEPTLSLPSLGIAALTSSLPASGLTAPTLSHHHPAEPTTSRHRHLEHKIAETLSRLSFIFQSITSLFFYSLPSNTRWLLNTHTHWVSCAPLQ